MKGILVRMAIALGLHTIFANHSYLSKNAPRKQRYQNKRTRNLVSCMHGVRVSTGKCDNESKVLDTNLKRERKNLLHRRNHEVAIINNPAWDFNYKVKLLSHLNVTNLT